MKNILIIKKEKAYLPEAEAYKDFLEENNYNVKIIKNIDKEELKWADIIWNFMGLDINRIKYKKKHFIIHDYRSLSSSKFRDKLRKKINLKPNLRIFLNDVVKNGFDFQDDVININLDMGINVEFLNKKIIKKKYKFVYCGAINKFREIDKVLKWFLKNYKNNEEFLLIGEPSKEIINEFKDNKNIKFTGKISYNKVPEYLKQGEFAICNIPNIYPYNEQTPTKLLEYIAMDLKIVTNETPWIKKFLEDHPNQKMYIYKKLDSLNRKDIELYDYKNIDMRKYTWDEKINEAKLLEAIKI